MKKVEIFWLPLKHGGKSKVPTTNCTYYAITRIDNNSWSISVNIKQSFGNRVSLGELTFLFEEAPKECLTEKNKIDIFEGAHKVGVAVILKD